MDIRLFIFISDKCNFSCKHCVSNSSSKANQFLIDDTDIELVTTQINTNNGVKEVHFTGGEPSLFVELMQKIQNGVKRKVHWGMTTNGWFGKNAANHLRDIHLDEMAISYDKFHKEFIDHEIIDDLIKYTHDNSIRVKINSVYESISDISITNDINHNDAEPVPTNMLYAGRANQISHNPQNILPKVNPLDSTCPSLNNEISKDLIYMPGEGFTVCCGSLLFDNLQDESFLFTKNVGEKNQMQDLLTKGNFKHQLELLAIEPHDLSFNHVCEACKFIYGKIDNPKAPSLYDVLTNNKYPVTLPLSKELPLDQAKSLNLKIVYMYAGNLPKQDVAKPLFTNDFDITIMTTYVDFEEKIVNLLNKIYFEPNKNHFTPDGIKETTTGFLSYLEKSQIGLYFINNELVGLLMGVKLTPHPFFELETFHIGFWGYDKSLVSKDQARFIIADWIKKLREWNASNQPLSISVDWFNHSSIGLIKKSGLNLSKVRFEKKGR